MIRRRALKSPATKNPAIQLLLQMAANNSPLDGATSLSTRGRVSRCDEAAPFHAAVLHVATTLLQKAGNKIKYRSASLLKTCKRKADRRAPTLKSGKSWRNYPAPKSEASFLNHSPRPRRSRVSDGPHGYKVAGVRERRIVSRRAVCCAVSDAPIASPMDVLPALLDSASTAATANR